MGLAALEHKMRQATQGLIRFAKQAGSALILVGRVLAGEDFEDSVLYGAAKEWL